MTDRIVTSPQLEHLLSIEATHTYSPDTTYSSPFLRLLVSVDREHLVHSFTEHKFVRGEIVCLEGEKGDTMYLIRSGRVAIVKGDLDSPTILDFRAAGDIIGEMAILENQPRSATLIALDSLQMLGVNRQNFENLLREAPSVSLLMMEVLSSRLRRTDEARSTGELSEKRLISQVSALQNEKKRLEESQRMRQETTELIIHDLRNPLSTIAISLRMLTFVLPEDVLKSNQELISVAQSSCERMQILVDAVLEVSQMESGEARFVMNEVNLGPMIEDAVHRASILTEEELTMETSITPGLPPVVADREKIERVLVNLLDNALKYTPNNGRITFAAKRQDGFVEVSLTDNGPGILPEERERIFERFTQGAAASSSRRGVGLGLTYCRLVIERHGGRIWVEPGENGTGSRFIFTLPINPKNPGRT